MVFGFFFGAVYNQVFFRFKFKIKIKHGPLASQSIFASLDIKPNILQRKNILIKLDKPTVSADL